MRVVKTRNLFSFGWILFPLSVRTTLHSSKKCVLSFEILPHFFLLYKKNFFVKKKKKGDAKKKRLSFFHFQEG